MNDNVWVEDDVADKMLDAFVFKLRRTIAEEIETVTESIKMSCLSEVNYAGDSQNPYSKEIAHLNEYLKRLLRAMDVVSVTNIKQEEQQ